MAEFLTLDPDRDLEFRRPFTSVVKQSLTVTNPSSTEAIAFKVKTTAPKQYCVRPNSGRIAPGGSSEVQVLLQAMKEDPPADFKCKDKFLVQSIKVPNDVLSLEGDELTDRLSELWTKLEHMKKVDPENSAELISEKKLKCVYLPAVSSGPSLSVPSSIPTTTAGASTTNDSPAAPKDAYSAIPSLASSGDRELRELKDQVKRLTAACDGYKAEAERLGSLRQRKTGGSVDDVSKGGASGAGLAQQQAPGLNMQLVALIALIAFLLGAYLF